MLKAILNISKCSINERMCLYIAELINPFDILVVIRSLIKNPVACRDL